MFNLAIDECFENYMLFNKIASSDFVNKNQALQDKKIFPKILRLLEKDPNKYNIEGFIRVTYNTNSEFFEYLIDNNEFNYNEILFLIGGAEGLSESVRNMSDFKFSMSKLTFLHQEAVLILVEQIYRAYKILNNEQYHK